MMRFIQKILARFDFELKYRAQTIYAQAETARTGEQLISGYTMLSRTCLVSLADQIEYCNLKNLPGAFVECGVWKGGAVAFMAHVSKSTGRSDRELHLFDAFTEICAPNPEVDGEKAIAETAKYGAYQDGNPEALKGIYDSKGGHGTIEDCNNVICNIVQYPRDKVHFHQGWFQDTVVPSAKKIGPIALLRLDGDWYDSTKICLEAFYDSVVSGGFIVIDDYLAYEGCKKAVDEFIFSRSINVFLTRADTGCYFFIKP